MAGKYIVPPLYCTYIIADPLPPTTPQSIASIPSVLNQQQELRQMTELVMYVHLIIQHYADFSLVITLPCLIRMRKDY